MTRKALYPGTFDPVTRGHEDIMRRAASMFDTLVVAVAENPAKKPMFDIKDRIQFIETVLQYVPNVEVIGYTGLTIELAKKHECCAMIRGLRGVTDFEYELHIANVNHHLAADIETVFLMSKPEYSFISSSAVRGLAAYDADIDALVHPFVSFAIKMRKLENDPCHPGKPVRG